MTFLKRDREMKLKQRALDKAARRANRKDNPNGTKGPPIDYESANMGLGFSAGEAPAAPPEHSEPPPRLSPEYSASNNSVPGPETK